MSEKLGAITAVMPKIRHRPSGMFAAGPATEIVARNQDRGAP